MKKLAIVLFFAPALLYAAPPPAATPAATPLYFTREITKADLEDRSLRELNLMRNVIYARAGNPFRKRWLHEHFSKESWYKPLDRMDESKLTPLDRRNAEMIAGHEVSLTRADLEKRRTAILSRIEYSAQKRIETIAFSVDGAMLATGGASVELWNAKTGKRTKVVEAANEEWKDDGVALSFSDDGKKLAIVRKSGAVAVADLATGKITEVVKANASNFFTDDSIYEDRASFARKPWRVAIANLRKEEDKTATIHELPSGKALTKTGALDSGEISFTPDGTGLVTFKDADMAEILSPASTSARTLALGEGQIERIAVSPDGKTVAALVLVDSETKKYWFDMFLAIEGGARIPLGLVSSSQRMAGRQPPTLVFAGNAAVAVGEESGLKLRELPSGAVRWENTDLRSLLHVDVSPDAKRIAVATESDGASHFTVLDASTGKSLALEGHTPATAGDLLELQLLSRAIGAEIPAIALASVPADEIRTPLDDVTQLEEHLKVEDLKDLSRRDLRLLRNAIYARRGRPFKSPVIREHFQRMVWYKADPKFTEARLTKVDQHNIKIVQSVEATLGGPLTDSGHIEEEENEYIDSMAEDHPSFEGQRWYSGA